MISEGLAWLKDMATARLNPPAAIIRAAQEHPGLRYTPQPIAVPPRPRPDRSPMPLRHTIPPQQSASFRGPQYGCVGLCPGGTCSVCDGLADEISAARRIKVPSIRDVREAALLRRINALKEGR